MTPAECDRRVEEFLVRLREEGVWDGFTLPVPIEEIATSLGYDGVFFGDLEREFGYRGAVGALRFDPPEIWVDSQLDWDEVEQRARQKGNRPSPEKKLGLVGRCHYTIAHEVAHIVLDEPKLGNRSEPTQHVFRSADHESNKGASEKSADMFAARLLMPADLVYAKWELIVPRTGTVDEPANRLEATRLARVFAVSRKAMGYRLADLGLISYKDRPPVTW